MTNKSTSFMYERFIESIVNIRRFHICLELLFGRYDQLVYKTNEKVIKKYFKTKYGLRRIYEAVYNNPRPCLNK